MKAKNTTNTYSCRRHFHLAGLGRSMVIAVISVCISVLVFCSTTLAYFKMEVSSLGNTIKSAYCNVVVSVKCDGNDILPADNKYTLEKDKDYIVTVTAEGSGAGAYCVVNMEGAQYSTTHICTDANQRSISFTISFSQAQEIEINTRWGTADAQQYDGIFEDEAYYRDLIKVN